MGANVLCKKIGCSNVYHFKCAKVCFSFSFSFYTLNR